MNKDRTHSSLNILLDNIEGTNLLLEYYEDFSKKIFECKDFNRIILNLHQELRKIYAKQNIEFILWRNNTELLKFVYDHKAGKVKTPYEIDADNTLYHYTLEQRQIILTNNYHSFCDNLQVDNQNIPASSWLGIPILVRGKVLGIVVIWDENAEHYFRMQDKQFLSTLTFIVAFALENISLFDYIAEKREPEIIPVQPAPLPIPLDQEGNITEYLTQWLLEKQEFAYFGIFLRSQSHDKWRIMEIRYKDDAFKFMEEICLKNFIYLQNDVFEQPDFIVWQKNRNSQPLDSVFSDVLKELPVNHLILHPSRIQHYYDCVLLLAHKQEPDTTPDEQRSTLHFIYAILLQSIERDLLLEHKKSYERYIQHLEKMKMVGELASGSAHHLNNILSVILGRTQILSKKLKDSPYVKDLTMIEKAAEDGAQAVKRLQSIKSKNLPQGKQELLDVNDLILEVVEITRPRFEREAQSFGLTYDVKLTLGSVTQVKGDAASLREVFLNLINNALDAMPKGGKMTIQTTLEKNKVFVFFSDTGAGITETVKEKIFQPFFSTKGENGNGLGLSIAAEIIAGHKGKIYVDSIPGKGSIFMVEFPAAEGKPENNRKPDSIGDLNCRVLLVDDENAVGDTLADMLREEGCQVNTCRNASEALEKFKSSPCDLVLTDLSMPGLNGMDLAKKVKEIRKNIPVIMITGWHQSDAEVQKVNGYIDGFIEKPFNIKQIRRAFQKVLNLNDL
jgi:signal transduction histidine kinase/CheY-like chemotaxis protein